MHKILTALIVMALLLAVVAGCGQKETEEPGKAPEGVREAEAMDTTRMDTAAMMDTTMMDTTMMDTMGEAQDSM